MAQRRRREADHRHGGHLARGRRKGAEEGGLGFETTPRGQEQRIKAAYRGSGAAAQARDHAGLLVLVGDASTTRRARLSEVSFRYAGLIR